MKKGLLSIFTMAVLMAVSAIGYAQTTYTKVNSASELEAGAHYILVGYNANGDAFAMGWQKTNNRHAVAVGENDGTITVTVATEASSTTDAFEFTLGGSAGAWTIYDPLNEGYLNAAGGGNYLKTQTTLDDKGKWTITDGENGGLVPVSNGGVEQNIMRYNVTSTLFGCYKSSSNVTDPVYFFKEGGEPVINPEPSNYPTNFEAAVNNLNVTLTWVDAEGGQLPSKYLVLASKGSIAVPQDGTPVENSNLAKNVNYGIQTVTFSGLESGATYRFAIFPYTNSGENIDYKTNGSYPTAVATTEEFFFFEDFTADLGQFTAVSVLGDEVWHQGTYQGTTYANMNGYANGSAHANEDWLISPALRLDPNNIYHRVDLEFSTAGRYEGNPLEVLLSVNYDGDPTTAVWEDLSDAFEFSASIETFEWVESGSVNILSAIPENGPFYIAFRYTSVETGARSWEIDYVKMVADYEVGVQENSINALSVYPNPANSVISFTLENNAQVSVYDVTGRMINTMEMAAGEVQYQIADFENGVYFLNVRYADGKMDVVRFVKY